MMTIHYFAEMLTTFAEIYILMLVFAFFFKTRYTQSRHRLLSLTGSIVLTAITLFLNSIQLFSVFTGFLWIILSSLIGWLLYDDHLLKIFSVSTVYILLISAFDFFCFSVMEFLLGFEGITFTLNSEIGWFRTIYILCAKLVLVVAYLCAKRIIRDKKYTFGIGSSIVMIAYGMFCISCMQNLFGAVATGDVTKMRKSVLLAWLFIMICAVSIIIMLKNRARLTSETQEKLIVEKQIEILESNNKQLNRAYEEMAKMSHDFNNQLHTISDMAANASSAELKEYLSHLVSDFERINPKIYTGVESIDAVLNRKERSAATQNIAVKISASYQNHDRIRNIDLCVVLANLFDNAIEACEKLQDGEKRFIDFSICNVGEMLVIKMVNSCDSKQSIKVRDGNLVTTKEAIGSHGYGLKIVRSIVEKYSGVAETTYNDDTFSVNILLNN